MCVVCSASAVEVGHYREEVVSVIANNGTAGEVGHCREEEVVSVIVKCREEEEVSGLNCN